MRGTRNVVILVIMGYGYDNMIQYLVTQFDKYKYLNAITHVAIYVLNSNNLYLNKISCCVQVYFVILACSFRIQHATNALLQKNLNGKFLELLPTLRVPGGHEIVAEKLR